MPRVIRARFENGVLRPLERLEIEAEEDIDKILAEVRGRGRSLYA